MIERADGLEVADYDDEVVVFDGETLHLLNGGAAEVWHLIDGTRTEADVVADLAARYATPTSVIASGVASLVADLRTRGLLRG